MTFAIARPWRDRPPPGVRRPSAPGLRLPERPRVGAEYMRGERSPVFYGWQPVLRDARDDVRSAWTRAASRAIDTIHNSGWLAGAVRQGCATMIGEGLRLASKPDFKALGWSQTFADGWAREAEKRWEAWAGNPIECDATGRFDLHQLAEMAVRSYFAFGEYVARVRLIPRAWSSTATKIELVPANRLTQDSNGVDMWQGVRMDASGMPLSYRLRLPHPLTTSGALVDVAARDPAGRICLLHVLEGDIGTIRGLSPLAPILQVVRQYDQLANATLTAAVLQTLLAATVKSKAPTADILQALQSANEQGFGGASFDAYLDARVGWYEKTQFDLGGLGKVVHLFPDEELDFKRAEHPNSNFLPQASQLMRETARGMGMNFEDVTGDYTGATYSSVRMGISTNWPIVLGRRRRVPARLYQSAYEAFLEEEVAFGRLGFPGGLDALVGQRAAASRADWRGPPKPQADDVKTATALTKLRDLGVMTDEQICAELGTDWEDVYDQRQREAQARQARGIKDSIAQQMVDAQMKAAEPAEPDDEKTLADG